MWWACSAACGRYAFRMRSIFLINLSVLNSIDAYISYSLTNFRIKIIRVDDDAPFHVNRCDCGVINPQAKRNLRIEAEYIGHQIIFL